MAFRLFSWHELPLGATYLITSLPGSARDGSVVCEAFLLAPKTGEPLQAMSFRCGGSNYQLCEHDIGLIDLEQHACGWAEATLEIGLLNWAQQNPGVAYPAPPKFAEVKPANRALIQLWLRQWEPDSLTRVKDWTTDPDLRNELYRILQLPPVAATPKR